MDSKLTKEELIAFEKEIEKLYNNEKIRAPVHLSGGNEEKLIEIFKRIKTQDWIFASYRNHYHALLKGIPREWIVQQIIEGRSMYMMSKEYRFFSSSIVPGQVPIAVGVALALKRKRSEDHVWVFCGDMAAETGVFHECIKFSEGHQLPITFVVEDDSLSVYTPTNVVWKTSPFSLRHSDVKGYSIDRREASENPRVLRYSYERTWPHHGAGIWVDFKDIKTESAPEGEQYIDRVRDSMKMLAKREDTIFIGQTVQFKGSPIYVTLDGVPEEKRLELPIMEEVQTGIATGLSLEGFLPISIYPRFDFLILATNQLVNHLDKIYELSHGVLNPKVIIRTMIGSKFPLYPGPQHFQDHADAFKKMLTNIDVIKVEHKKDVIPSYERAMLSERSTLIVEMVDLLHK